MNSRLPATPLDSLTISGLLKFIVQTIHRGADMFGFWRFPSKKAAADFEEMSLLDKIYWGYKSKKPIQRGEKGSELDAFFKKKSKDLSLPNGFDESEQITFSAVGDLIKVEGLENSKNKLYEKVAELIFNKDLSYANLESQLTEKDIGAYTFSEKDTPPLCLTLPQYDTLKGQENKLFTMMHTACNHTLDMGLEGVDTTLAQLKMDGIRDLGTNREPSQQNQGRIIQYNNIKIGMVSATFGLNGKEVPPGKEYVVNVVKFHPKRNGSAADVDLSLLERQITDCKEKDCDLIIGSLHWGYEYEFIPRQHQIDIAHSLVESGVDVLVSHHAHVLQPLEYYRTKRDPDRVAVIAYSLGNLTSSFSAPHLVLSGILNLVFSKGKINGVKKTYIRDAQLIPVVQRDVVEDQLPVIRLDTLEDFLAAEKKSKEEEKYAAAVRYFANLVL